MKIIKPSATLMEHNVSPYEFIERVGRTCYKSENNITEGSAEKFVRGLAERKHFAMLEHETLYVVTNFIFMNDLIGETFYADLNPKFFNITIRDNICVLSGSFRSFYELFEKYAYDNYAINHLQVLLQNAYPLVFDNLVANPNRKAYPEEACFLCSRKDFIDRFINEPEVLFKHLTHTILFVCDRGVSHEFVRHRPCSFAQESTRYCNYTKDKFGKEITVIDPFFLRGDAYDSWLISMACAEDNYFNLLNLGATPQEARSVLPNSLKTELIITATEEEWQHIVNLRYRGTTGAPHPQMKEVMSMAVEDLNKESGGRIEYN